MWEAATVCSRPAPCDLDLLTLKVVSKSRVTWATSVPILVFLGLSVLNLGLFHTDTSTGSKHSRQTTGAYIYHCAFTLARARALAEISCANVRVHSHCQRSAHAFTRVAEQEVGYLSIISIHFLLTGSEYSLQVLPTNVRREYSQQCEIGLRPDVRDRQTDVRRASSLNASALWRRGHNKQENKIEMILCTISFFETLLYTAALLDNGCILTKPLATVGREASSALINELS